MKTKNKTQKNVYGQVKMRILRGIAVLLSLVLISLTVTARDSKQKFSTNSNCGILTMDMSKMDAIQIESGVNFLEYNAQNFVEAEMEHEFENCLNNNTDTNNAFSEADLSLQVEGYNPNDFVETELEAETENFMNNNSEAIEAKLSFQVESYNAYDFVEAELAAETENFMNSTCDAVETELSLQVEAYNANDFVEAELEVETENYMNSNSQAIESELTLQAEVYNTQNFVDAEMVREIESWMTMQNSPKSTKTLSSVAMENEIEEFAQE